MLVVGKIGVPGHEELALAAVADDGRVALNPGVIAPAGLTTDEVGELARRHAAELARRAWDLRGGREPAPLEGRTVVVDDGMATGATMRVALDVAPAGAAPAGGGVPVAVSRGGCDGRRGGRPGRVRPRPTSGPWAPGTGTSPQVSDDEVRRLLDA